MSKRECIAMILAGGRGEKLGALTNYTAKPTISYGAKYRIIDFTLSNCKHSGIDTIGVLTEYLSTELDVYIGKGKHWGFDKVENGISMLPAGVNEEKYKGATDAVYKNIEYIQQFSPDNVLILSGDLVYRMDYREILDFHEKTGADATVATIEVLHKETSKYEIVHTDDTGLINMLESKPRLTGSKLASMGVYVFKWKVLKEYLISDHNNIASLNNFNKNILGAMIGSGKKLYSYLFNGYWRDVTTIESFWESNMDLIHTSDRFFNEGDGWDILTGNITDESYRSSKARITDSIISGPGTILGKIENSLLSNYVVVNTGAEITDSIIMSNVFIGENVKINKAIIGPGVKIMDNVTIGANYGIELFVDRHICSGGVSLISPFTLIREKYIFQKNSHINKKSLDYTFELLGSCFFDYAV